MASSSGIRTSHEHDVRVQRERPRDRGAAVLGLPHHRDVGLRVEDHAEASAHERLVVGDERADHRGSRAPRHGSRRPADDGRGLPPDHDDGAGRVGVLDGVRECLLHDPVRGLVEAGRQRPPRAGLLELDRDPARPHARRQLVEPLQGRARLRGAALPLAEEAEQAAELDERALQHPHGGVGLDDHDADRVRDHVVDLARDPRPLLGRSLLGPQLLLEREALGAPLRDGGGTRVRSEHDAGRPGGRGDRQPERVVAEAAVARVGRHRGGGDRQSCGEPRDRVPTVVLGADHPEAEQASEEELELLPGRSRREQREAEQGEERSHGREERQPPPGEQRQRGEQREHGRGAAGRDSPRSRSARRRRSRARRRVRRAREI
jgi:hypothetical protein